MSFCTKGIIMGNFFLFHSHPAVPHTQRLIATIKLIEIIQTHNRLIWVINGVYIYIHKVLITQTSFQCSLNESPKLLLS